MNEIQFFMPMNPPTVTDQEHRIGGDGKNRTVYDSPKLIDARNKLTAFVGKHKPETPFTVPVRLVVKWCFPIKGKHRNGEYKGTRPDTDNLNKMLKDCMTKTGFWKDDALVASEITEKFYADIPGIFIRIEVLHED